MSIGMVERYSHLREKHKEEAVQLICPKNFTTLNTTRTQNHRSHKLLQVVENKSFGV